MSAKKHLFEKVFEQAKKECGNSSKNAISNYLNTLITEEYSFQISSKSFSRYYDDILNDKIDERTISPILLNHLATYIGYNSFGEFSQQFEKTLINEKVDIESEGIQKINTDETSKSANPPKKKKFFEKNQRNKIIVGSGIASLLVGSGLFLNSFDNSSSCMVWKESHYLEIDCEESTPQMNAVPYNETVFRLKKITRIDTLNIDNAIDKVWYTKKNGEIEFYTNYGLHPENGKTLKPVTKYILTKYVLNKES